MKIKTEEQKLQEALFIFKVAAFNLAIVIDENNTPLKGCPFDADFNDIATKIIEWYMAQIQ